jgi:hypothetical protein
MDTMRIKEDSMKSPGNIRGVFMILLEGFPLFTFKMDHEANSKGHITHGILLIGYNQGRRYRGQNDSIRDRSRLSRRMQQALQAPLAHRYCFSML